MISLLRLDLNMFTVGRVLSGIRRRGSSRMAGLTQTILCVLTLQYHAHVDTECPHVFKSAIYVYTLSVMLTNRLLNDSILIVHQN